MNVIPTCSILGKILQSIFMINAYPAGMWHAPQLFAMECICKPSVIFWKFFFTNVDLKELKGPIIGSLWWLNIRVN